MKSVREYFKNDLQRVGKHGTCFLPEWICMEMGLTVENCGWDVIFYNVEYPKKALNIFSFNKKDLFSKIESCASKNIVVLFAHPMGYIDSNIENSIQYLKLQYPKINIFLDLAQSYGAYNFVEEVKQSDISYISYNGNKLINSGGAERIKSVDFENYLLKQKQYAEKAKEQSYKFSSYKNGLQQFFNDGGKIDQEKTNLRSSLYRTAIKKSELTLPSEYFEDNGYGQSVHPNPQYGLIEKSEAYKEWEDKFFLFFSKKRNKEQVNTKRIYNEFTRN